MIKRKVNETAFKYLLECKNSYKKVKHISYSQFKTQNYLLANQISSDLARFIFLARSRMLNLRSNYSSQYNKNEQYCPVCCDQDKKDDQEHLVDCRGLLSNQIVVENVNYSHLFSEDLTKQLRIGQILQEKYELRNKLLKN